MAAVGDGLAGARRALAAHDWAACIAAVHDLELDDSTAEAERLDLL